MLSRSEKLNVAKAGSVIVNMVCAVVLVRFISNTSDDDQSASCSFAVLDKQADTVPKKLGEGKRGEGSGRELKSSRRVEESWGGAVVG